MILFWTFLYIVCTVSVSAEDCSVPMQVIVNETAPAGTIILTTTVPVTDNFTFTANVGASQNQTFLTELQGSFLLKINQTNVVLSLNKSLDLEKFYENFTVDISTIKLEINCQGIKNVPIYVQSVNEFSPVFIDAPYRIKVPESTPVGDVVFEVKNKTFDRDFGQTTNFFINLHNYTGNVTDGQTYFEIRVVTRGYLRVKKTLDFDNANIPKHFALNVSVEDDGNHPGSYTEIYIDIQDVDDQNPYFNYPGCTQPCALPEFDTITDLQYTGVLPVKPVPLEGQDKDTLNTQLLYSISAGNEHNMFTIDSHRAVVTQRISVNSTQLPDSSFRLIVKVRKNVTQDLSSQAILIVRVKGRALNNTDYPPETTTSNDNKTSLLIIVIILAVVATLVLIGCIVVSVLYRKNRKTMIVTPDKNKNKNFKNGSAELFEKPVKSEFKTDVNQPVGKRLAAINDRVKNGTEMSNGIVNKSKDREVESNKTVLDENRDNDVAKEKRKKRKKRKILRARFDDVGSTETKDTELGDKNLEPIIEPHLLPPSFNKAPPLPIIGSNPKVEVERDGENVTESKVEKKKPKYPTLTDAFNSEPPTWDAFPTTLV